MHILAALASGHNYKFILYIVDIDAIGVRINIIYIMRNKYVKSGQLNRKLDNALPAGYQ